MSGETMTPLQRTLSAFSFQEPDRVPLFLLTAMQGARELGLSLQAYFSQAENVIAGQIRLQQKYRSDCLYSFYYASLEVEAWGGSTLFLDDGPPQCGAPILRRPESIDTLQPPMVAGNPPLEKVPSTLRGLKAWAGDRLPIIGVAISPFSLPVMQMGFEGYLELMHRQPARFQRLMDANMTQSDLQGFFGAAQSCAELLRRNLERIAGLVDAFREVAVQGRNEPLRSVALLTCLLDVLQSFGERLSPERFALEVRCPAKLQARGSASDWASIVRNLISNSLKHGFRNRASG